MIPVQNIYYMLAYAFKALKEDSYKTLATENFENVGELCAAVLSKGIAIQLKRGLGKEYVSQTEPLSLLRGKIDIAESIKTQALTRNKMVCTYDDFTVNSYLNRILKTTLALLIRSDISKERKKELRKLLVFFAEVETLDLHNINWYIRYNRNNQTYHMLISVCYLVVKGLIQSSSAGCIKLMDYFDEQRMCRLYEKFILEYYRKEHPEIKVHPAQIAWQLDDDFSAMLPIMQTDIMLSSGNRILIIDAKYYNQITQSQYNVHSLRSGHLYQLFTYVKNKDAEFGDDPHQVSGMLLYAQTDDENQHKYTYNMSGNKMEVRTLNLNCHFSEIATQLDSIIEDYFS